jgi:hypothetical protein
MFDSKREGVAKQSGDSQMQAVMPKKKMGQFEKWFWITIGVLFLVWVLLQVVATSKEVNVPERSPDTVTENIIEGFGLKVNLENAKQTIDDDLSSKLSGLDRIIDAEVEKAFAPAYSNVDRFLDYHYSVVGEYAELGAALEGKVAEKVNNMIFGSEFGDHLSHAFHNVNNEYAKYLNEHFDTVKNVAVNGVDTNLNADKLKNVFDQLSKDIGQRFETQNLKATAVVGTAATAGAAAIGAKVVSKLIGKTAVKAGAKVGAKAAAAGTAATGGVLCGPAAPLCAAGLAIGAWFATDAAVVAVDEHLNRDELRAQIIRSIDEEKKAFAESLKQSFYTLFKEQSDTVQETLKATPVKVKDQILK